MTARQTHLADQLLAASEHADQVVNFLGEAQGAPRHITTGSPWLWDLLDQVATADARCAHLLGSSPAVVFLPAHRKRLLCAPCSAADLARTRGTREDRTCDSCRRLCHKIHPVAWAVGPTVVTAGACATCLPVIAETEVAA